MEPADDGAWVSYEDHCAAIAAEREDAARYRWLIAQPNASYLGACIEGKDKASVDQYLDEERSTDGE